MGNTKIEEAYNQTFSGLTMYYRDCELDEDLISKYQVNQILLEKGFVDVSSFAEGLGKNLRYVIVSNKAMDMGKINPEVAKFGLNLISAPSYYKVLDIYEVEEKTQIVLLHFYEPYLEIFSATNSNIEKKVVEMGRASLDEKIQIEPSSVLNEKEWKERTNLPIGMSDTGNFFLNGNSEPKKPKNSQNGIWNKLFGKNNAA